MYTPICLIIEGYIAYFLRDTWDLEMSVKISRSNLSVEVCLPILRTGVCAMSWAMNWLHSITASVLVASDWSFAVDKAALTSLGLGSGFFVCPIRLGSWMPASQIEH